LNSKTGKTSGSWPFDPALLWDKRLEGRRRGGTEQKTNVKKKKDSRSWPNRLRLMKKKNILETGEKTRAKWGSTSGGETFFSKHYLRPVRGLVREGRYGTQEAKGNNSGRMPKDDRADSICEAEKTSGQDGGRREGKKGCAHPRLE